MATWTHFTSYLDGSRSITKNERDELYDQLNALLTGGCSGAGYSLNSTDQTAIKNSNLLTDRAGLNGPGSTNTRDRLQSIIATASTAFVNYSSAVTVALSGEGITATQRDAIITASVEHHKLWNYYKRLIDALSCCTAPVITSAGSASGSHGSAFSYQITATNSPTSYGATGLPGGLSINTSTGLISGTLWCPSVSIVVSATNACGSTGTKSVTITVSGGNAELNSPTTASGLVGVPFSFFLTAANGATAFDATPLPDGLTINTSTGEISGTPTMAGVTSATTSAYNACGGSTGTLQITINDSCPLPSLLADSIQVQHAKAGYFEYAGYESIPPKIYLASTWSGSMQHQGYSVGPGCGGGVTSDITTHFAGVCSYDEITGVQSGAHTVDGTPISGNCGISLAAFLTCWDGPCAPIYDSTHEFFIGDQLCYFTSRYSGQATETLSLEYTTAMLVTNTESLLPSYPGTWDGGAYSLRDLTSDEITYTIQRFKYKFQLPDLTGFSSYAITWMEGSTPRNYTWNGTDTETPTYEVFEPSSNGTVVITDVEVTCS